MKLLALLVLLAAPDASLRTVAIPPSRGAMATVELAFRAGSIDDPPAAPGLTALGAEVLARGAADEAWLYERGAAIEVQVDREQTVFTARAPRPFIAEVSRKLARALAQPTVDPAALEAAAGAAAAAIRSIRDDDQALAAEELVATLFPQHPYQHLPLGTFAGIANARPESVRAQLARVLTRDRLTVGVSGGYSRELPQLISHELSALPWHGAPVAALGQARSGPRVVLVERAGEATTITLGLRLQVRRGDPDFIPLMVGISALGEHRQFTGRLFEALRSRRGLNYGDYAYAERFVQDGASTFSAPHLGLREQYFSLALRPVANGNRVFALRAALHVVRELVARGLDEPELERTRRFLAGAARLWAQTDERRLGWAIDGAFYGDPDLLAHLRAALPHVTVAQVNAALRRHLDPDGLSIVMVGPDAKALASALASKAPSPPRYAKAKLAFESEDAAIAQEPIGQPDGIEVLDADSLFEN